MGEGWWWRSCISSWARGEEALAVGHEPTFAEKCAQLLRRNPASVGVLGGTGRGTILSESRLGHALCVCGRGVLFR